MNFIEGQSREQASLLPPLTDDYVLDTALVRVVDAFVASLRLDELAFERAIASATGRPGCHPGDMLRLYIWGYLNQVRSSRHLERACLRDLEALWLVRRLAPDTEQSQLSGTVIRTRSSGPAPLSCSFAAIRV